MFQSLWNWLFFWQNVPDEIPVKVNRFRVLNLKLIREVALDLLHYPDPKPRLWGWDQVLHAHTHTHTNTRILTSLSYELWFLILRLLSSVECSYSGSDCPAPGQPAV